jgi:uncharacterized membrane protein
MGLIATLAGGLCLGLALGLLFDPRLGHRRRVIFRDKAIKTAHVVDDAIDTTSRDFANRTRGLIAGIRSRVRPETVSDVVLVERVRATLGAVVSHPRSIEVTAREGCVTLRGPVFADEVHELVRRVAAVRGTRSVDNQLEAYTEPADHPGLQGIPGRRRGGSRFELLQVQWSPTARLVTGIAGGALGLVGLLRPGLLGSLAAGAGLTLLVRAVTNLELRRLFGIGAGRRAVTVHKTIEVKAPIEEVFDVWSRYENFPRFMAHILDVRRVGPGRARWTVAGPGGVPIEWETIETRHVPNEIIEWETVEGAVIAHTGRVRFAQYPDATRIDVRMAYNPLAGAVGHAVASLLGANPKRAMDEDLVRFKSLLEEGKASARGQTTTRDALG